MLRIYILDEEVKAFKYLGDWEASFVFPSVVSLLDILDVKYVIIPENTIDIVRIIEEGNL